MSLPPLNALRVFVTAADRASFSDAAGELGVSQASVSRQISNLENFFSVSLFERRTDGVRLTKSGKALAKDIRPAFEAIENATQRLISTERGATVHVRTYPTFAATWLMPRLNDFKENHPDFDVKLDTGIERGEAQIRRFDAAILLIEDDRPPKHARALKMFPDVIEPVCSPAFLDRVGPVTEPAQLQGLPLLHSVYRRDDWRHWLADVGVEGIDPDAGAEFGGSVLSYQAARGGLGIAMGQHALIEHDLSVGTLVKVFDRPLIRKASYAVMTSKDHEVRPKTRAFIDWLMGQCGEQMPYGG